MNQVEQSKILTLKDAIHNVARRGDHLSMGGFAVHRNSMATVHETIRYKITGLHLTAHADSLGTDTLVGAGALQAMPRLTPNGRSSGEKPPLKDCF